MSGPFPPSSLRGWWLRLRRTRPPIAWSASLLFLSGGLTCLVAVALPVSATEPVPVDAAIGAISCVVGLVVWLQGARLPAIAFQVLMALATVMVSAIVAAGTTKGGVILTAFAYPWIAVYAAHFFPRRAVILQSVLIAGGFGAGLLIDGLHHVAVAWLLVTGTVATTALILGNLSETLRRQADTDQLTGLLNRNGFLTAAMRERASAARSGEPLTVVVLDLDGFKQVNDRLGHAAGDRLLERLGAEWKARLRGRDILARHGGDEFVLLLPATRPDGAQDALARMRVPDLAVRFSAGVSEWRPDEDIDECLARADRSLYASKDLMRDAVQPDLALAAVR